jgi:hypothetical protein
MVPVTGVYATYTHILLHVRITNCVRLAWCINVRTHKWHTCAAHLDRLSMWDVWGHGVRCACRSRGRGQETPAASLPFRGPANRLLLPHRPLEGLLKREASRATAACGHGGDGGSFNGRLGPAIEP